MLSIWHLAFIVIVSSYFVLANLLRYWFAIFAMHSVSLQFLSISSFRSFHLHKIYGRAGFFSFVLKNLFAFSSLLLCT